MFGERSCERLNHTFGRAFGEVRNRESVGNHALTVSSLAESADFPQSARDSPFSVTPVSTGDVEAGEANAKVQRTMKSVLAISIVSTRSTSGAI